MDLRDKHKENLRRQLERSRATYLMMREVGYDKSKAVRLEWAFYPATEENAVRLATFLRETTKYEVEVGVADDEWIIRGHTPPVKLSAATLGRWVLWMCRLGYKYDTLFDGWGTRLGSS